MTDIKKRNLYFIGYIFTSKILALIIIIWKYGLFKKLDGVYPKYKISIWGAVALIWFLISFWSEFVVFARDMKEGFLRELLHGISSIMLPLVIWVSGVLAHYFIKDYLFFSGTILVTSMLGVFLRSKYTYYKRQILIDRGYVHVLKD